MSLLELDSKRYSNEKIPLFQRYFRLIQETDFLPLRLIYKILFRMVKRMNCVELHEKTTIGGGCYFSHPYCITINPETKIGKNVNIHKGVTIGQENRGKRKGTPVIGDEVWIGVNATLVGKIVIGNDVLVAPNSYVNCDIPDHSVVYGNPCVIESRENATQDYINRKIDDYTEMRK